MPFLNGVSRKRRPSCPAPASSPARSVSSPVSKMPKLSHLLYDGTNSRSIESTSTGRSKVSVKNQFKRRVSNIKTILGIGGRHDDADLQHHSETVFTSGHGSQLGYILQNDSNATTLYHPLRIRLTAVDEAPAEHTQSDALSTVKSAPITPEPQDDENLIPTEWPGFSEDVRRTVRRSQSLPGLHQRITQKFHQAFGNPTVVRRTDLRSRPSLQTFANDATEPISAQLSSAPSTVNSGTGTPYNRATSTPLTSMPVTPTSMARRDYMNSFDIDTQTYFAESRLLTPIPETAALPTVTIKTVEAAAAAKVFFEMHFNTLLNAIPARALRRRELEVRILQHHLPVSSQYRARAAWARAESDNLRQSRVLKNSANHEKASQGITIGGFDVISVLGKGSFGVVRLIKGTNSKDIEEDEDADEQKKKPHPKSSASSSRLASRAPGGVVLNKRNQLANSRKEVFAMKVIRKSDMVRNGQEGHLRAERDFLVAAEGSRWVIPLIAAFQDQKHLYLVMEYCIGGDFLGLLIRKNVLSEEITKWYIAEMVLCVEEAHRMRWIHRDMKPDNFLISVDGHLKISDFGLAFDGEWSHDQRFYHESRHSLLGHLGLDIEGDEQDRREKEHRESKDSAACTTSKTSHRTPFMASDSRDEPMIGEPIVDWRNRSQRRRLARSVVGTSQYMSPEVIRGEMYDGRCD
ncbi:protein kinase [Exophiala viscosa]|uniref:non-specific serine/threonine protein kinase n=1 Tax=Exophiala viscosa TaxID=2486360 RepID=A0AAN6DNK4_9EURO|nr:protein kinase [Exophiala viscosa]